MKELTLYFSGHDFEYEARNSLRIFDLNIGYKIKKFGEIKNNEGLGLSTLLEEKEGSLYSKACLYFNDKLLYTIEYNSNDILIESDSDKKLKKVLVIKSIHNVLKKYYNVTPDYGVLTGVRVIKIMTTARKYKKTNEEITRILRDTYEINDEKIKLLWDVLKIEEKYINEEQNKKNYNLYIGIPFCPSRCSYCSFTSYVDCKEDKVNDYVNTLIFEIEETIHMALKKGLKLNAVYIGGGTPSVLNEHHINIIFNSINKFYDLSKVKEVTFEAGRPDTLTEEKLICLRENHVNRISINPQTMNEKTLQDIGRKHTTKDIIEKYNLARKIGFQCINMDIILGLPGENHEDVKHTIDEIIKLNPENITVHALAYKKKSELTRDGKELSKDYDLINKMHEVVKVACYTAGYTPYYMYRQKNIKGNSENIGFTLEDKESIYNIVIIEEIETILACGLGASSKIKKEDGRHEPLINFKSLEEYKGRIHEIINKKKLQLEIK